MKIRAALSSLVLLGVLGVTAIVHAQKTSYDFDRTADFSKFRTFAWAMGSPAGEPFLDKRIITAIESQLVAKGLTKSELNPDLHVRYHVAVAIQKSLTGSRLGDGPPGWHGGLDTFDARLNDIPVGGLVLDLVDASKRELVWRGVGMSEIDVEAKPERRDVAIVKAVEKILKNYPPKSR